ncbi:MAG: hypothetical protein ACR2JE_04835 [Acidobacteriaceae bacterium]
MSRLPRIAQAAAGLCLFLAPSLLLSQAVPSPDAAPGANAATVSPNTTAATFSVYPSTAAVLTGTHQTFQGQIYSLPDKNAVTFAVDGQAGGSSTKGTISGAGVYTAPTTPGTHTVTAMDSSTHQTSSSRVTVYSKVAVDFGSRSNSLHAIPAGMFGAEHFDSLHDQADIDMVVAAGFNYARFYAELPAVFPTAASVSAPLWQKVDHNFQTIGVAGGTHIMVQLVQTPSWLVKSGTCKTAPATAMPSNVNTWAKLAALYVAHMDQKFPGIVTEYEIWNEPNTGALCDPGGNQLTDYQTLYAAAAPLMKAQAARDGKTIHIGGPVTAGIQRTWIQALTTNPKTAPYVDFLSYHQYLFGNKELNATWDTFYGVQSVYQRTQDAYVDPRNTYLIASSMLAAGKQPGGIHTPIDITEYNLNWSFNKNCCANNPTISPVWNSLYVADLLNTVYAGAYSVPGKIVYFGANAHPYFCLIGTIDAARDCLYVAGSVPQAYPQYYTYQLIAGTKYLGLANGGHMAASISPGNAGGGLVVSAFFNATQDSILIINPTGQAYSSLNVSAVNTGYTSGGGTLYQIVNGQQIRSSSVALTRSGTSVSTNIPVPAYSVQAISIK